MTNRTQQNNPRNLDEEIISLKKELAFQRKLITAVACYAGQNSLMRDLGLKDDDLYKPDLSKKRKGITSSD